MSVCDNSTNSTSDPEPEVVEVASLKKDNVDAILDPANFSLDPLPVAKARVTKDSFMMMKNSPQLGAVNDPSDPLSLLDPLWSLGTKWTQWKCNPCLCTRYCFIYTYIELPLSEKQLWLLIIQGQNVVLFCFSILKDVLSELKAAQENRQGCLDGFTQPKAPLQMRIYGCVTQFNGIGKVVQRRAVSGLRNPTIKFMGLCNAVCWIALKLPQDFE